MNYLKLIPVNQLKELLIYLKKQKNSNQNSFDIKEVLKEINNRKK